MSFNDFSILKPENLTGVIKAFVTPEVHVAQNEIFTKKRNVDFGTATWDEVIGTRYLANFNVQDGAATPKPRMTIKQRSDRVLSVFEFINLPQTFLNWTRYPGTESEKRIEQKITDELDDAFRRIERTKEFLCWMALTGQLTISQSRPAAPIKQVVNWPVHAQSYVADWSNAATKIVSSELEALHAHYEENTEFEIAKAYFNRLTQNYLWNNTEVRYVISDNYKDTLRTAPYIVDVDGIGWRRVNKGYLNPSDVFQKYIADKYIIFLPDEVDRVVEMQEASMLIPNAAGDGLQETFGYFAFVKIEYNPPSAVLFYGWNGLPVITYPDAVTYFEAAA